MSSSIWTRCAGDSELRALRLKPWRIVEAQHLLATRKLVDTAEEQMVLEEMLEASKPPRVGPARRARCSVATPISPAAGTSDTAEVTNTQIETPLCQRSHRLMGAAINRQFSHLPVTILSN
jgi:hypothetical protein